jgi:hypothetical protein
MSDKRSEPRFRFELAVTLHAGRRSWKLSTHDVSYRGMFVALQDPPRPRELVRVEATLPEGERLTLQGMIAFVTAKGDEFGRPRGAGIQFFGSGGPEHELWEGFVRKVWGEQHRLKPKSTAPAAHVTVVLRVKTKDTAGLDEVVAALTSRAGLPIETDHLLQPGRTMALEIVHPHTGEILDVTCAVRRTPTVTSVEPLDLGPAATRRLTTFASSGARPAPRG